SHHRLAHPAIAAYATGESELTSADRLTRCGGMDGKRMHTARQLRREQLIDHAVTFDTGLPFEGIRHDINPLVSLPARSMPCMAFVLMRFINDFQALRRESFGQLLCDEIGSSHAARLGEYGGPVNGHKQVLKASPARAHNIRS